jgi:hypothetical protein
MSVRNFVVVIVAGCLCGCAGAPPISKSPLTCNSAEQCRVTVQVVNCPHCAISVAHDTVEARGFDVVWEIANASGQSYQFDRDKGIGFKTNAGKQVFRCHVEANGSRYKCNNRKDAGQYEYGVTLVGTPAVTPLDPWVVNR